MLQNMCGASRRTDATPNWLPARKGRAFPGIAAAAFSLAGFLAVAAVASAHPHAPAGVFHGQAHGNASEYRLTVQILTRIQKGKPAALILHVQKNGQPANNVVACMATAPLFPSEEDIQNATPAMGIDLGTGAESTFQPGCVMAMAAVRTAPGIYRFTWVPDTAGRVNLRFTAGDSRLNVAVNVGSAPPNPAILIGFVVLVGVILGAAATTRRRRLRQGGSS